MFRRLVLTVAALGLVLARPAFAVEINLPLPISSQTFGVDTNGNCHGTPGQDQLDWHFVLKQSATDDQTLTMTFQSAGTITVSPDQIKDSYVLHYDVYTNGDDTLLAASTSGDTGTLDLKDICGP
jgi:hypothetical protein